MDTFQSRLELLEARQMLAGDVLQNPVNAVDVNNDAHLSPMDAMIVVREMQSNTGVGAAAAGEPDDGDRTAQVFPDVDGDGSTTAQDLNTVVSQLNLASGEPGDVVTFRLEAVDLSGNTITTIDPGTEFDLVVFVQDTQPSPEGVFAAYLDIDFTETLATALSIDRQNSRFANALAGDIGTQGEIDELGGFDQNTPTVSEDELARIRMRADNPGTLSFSANPADEPNVHEVLVFNDTNAVSPGDILYPTLSLQVNGTLQSAPDLVAFAQALSTANVQLWTSDVNARGNAIEQLALFEEGQHFLNTAEVFDYVPGASGTARFPTTTAATQANVTQSNIWIWPDGSRSDGSVLTLQEISTESGVAIPETFGPSIVPIEDTTVLAGSPLHIPLDGYDPNGDDLTFTVSVGDSNLIETFIPQGNRSLRIPVTQGADDLGEMVFQLFEGRAPRATQRIIDLEATDFHDNIIFHRIIDEFVIQGGDPTGLGTGGSSLGDFDDQFHVDLQHNQTGILSMAKSSDDTNDSQFFITEPTTSSSISNLRNLDFNHTVFGQLIEGERTRQTLSNVDTVGQDRPITDAVMNNVEVFQDTENAVVMLRALADTGTTTVTVTATDSTGTSTSETFTVDLAADTVNGRPFLRDITSPTFTSATDSIQIEAVDVESDPFVFSASLNNGETGESVSITPSGVLTASGWTGVRQATISVQAADSNGNPVGAADEQVIDISIVGAGPSAVDLLAATDSGLSNQDNITNVTELQFEVFGVSDDDLVIVLSGETEIGRAIAEGDSVVITQANTSALGSGQQSITAVVENDGIRTQASPAISLTLDQDPPAALTNTAPSTGEVNTPFVFDAAHEDEGAQTIRYVVENAPTGMQIDALTGVIDWTPTFEQRGTQTFDIVAVDLAGNRTSSTQTVDIQAEFSANVTLEFRDFNDNPAGTVASGRTFLVDIFIEDLQASANGIASAFVDLALDPQSVARVDPAGTIQIGSDFSDSQQTGTVSGNQIINLGGASATPVTGRRLLATVPMIAESPGTLIVDLSLNSAGITVGGETQPVPESDVQLSGGSMIVLGISADIQANDDALTIDEDSGEHTIPVLSNDTVATNGGAVTITNVTLPSGGGTVSIAPDNVTLVYQPAPDFPVGSSDPGTDTFDYTITDATGGTSTATVTVTVNPVNDPPTANDDVFPDDFSARDRGDFAMNLREDSTDVAELFVIQNDSPAPDNELAIFLGSATSDTGAIVEVINNRTWIGYRPGPNVFGQDTFTYVLEDAADSSLTDTATVTVNIAQVNDAPVAADDTVDARSGETTELPAALFLDNDSAGPLEDSSQTLTILSTTQPSQGSVTVNADGSLTYVANANATGTDTFSYTVSDDGVTEDFDANSLEFTQRNDFLESTATVTIRLDQENQAPNAVNDNFPIANDGTSVVLPVAQNDQDDEALTVTEVSSATAGGTVTLTDGVVRYQPADGFVGTDTFTYTVSDGELTSSATVTVEVLSPNDATNSQFAGTVFFDLNNNGQQDTGERGIAGVPIQLFSTTAGEESRIRVSTTDANGEYRFEALPAGSYSVRQTQSGVLADGDESASGFATTSGNDAFSITVADNVVISEGNSFAERGFSPRYAMLDMLSSRRSPAGFLASVGENESGFVDGVEGWDGFSNIRVSLSTDQSQVTIRATNSDAEEVSTTVDTTDKSRVSLLGRTGDTYLLRITAAAAAFIFQADDDNTAN